MSDAIEGQLYGKRIIGTVAIMAGIHAVETEFMKSLAGLIQYNQEYLCAPNEIIYYTYATFSEHSAARNALAEGIAGDWILMLDCDHWFNPNILTRLLRLMFKYKLPVLSAIYQMRHPPYPALIYGHGATEENPFELLDFSIDSITRDDEIMQIAACGAGCLLINKEVFIQMNEKLREKPFSHRPPFSEDLSFFLRCKELNIPVHVAPWIECHHINHVKIKMTDYDNSDIKYSKRREIDIPIK